MKDPLKFAADEGFTKLNVKEGQYIFYKTSRIFGKITSTGPHCMTVDWEVNSGIKTSAYTYSKMSLTGDTNVDELLNRCLLCESDEDKLFIELKYGR